MLSVRPSGAFKPDARCYRYGLEKMGVAPDQSLMIACHPWDLIGGAMRRDDDRVRAEAGFRLVSLGRRACLLGKVTQ